jgi:hypothetical protein
VFSFLSAQWQSPAELTNPRNIDDLDAGRGRFGPWSNQRFDLVTALLQKRNKSRSDVAGASGYED